MFDGDHTVFFGVSQDVVLSAASIGVVEHKAFMAGLLLKTMFRRCYTIVWRKSLYQNYLCTEMWRNESVSKNVVAIRGSISSQVMHWQSLTTSFFSKI